jgi:hypothetical protein
MAGWAVAQVSRGAFPFRVLVTWNLALVMRGTG